MRILITGGAGFIGSHLVEAALADGHQVAVLDNLSTGRRENVPDGVRLDEVDLCSRELVRQVVADFAPDVVSHQAAQASVSVSVRHPDFDANVNILGGLNLLDACRESGVRKVIFASTGGALYGHVPEPERARLGRPINPSSPYAVSKAAFEFYLRNYRLHHGLDFQTLRYANIYGPRQDPHGEAGVIAIFCSRLLAGEEVTIFARETPGDGGCVRDYTYVGDVVAAHRAAIAGTLSGDEVNVASGAGTTTQQLFEELQRIFGVTVPVVQAGIRPGDVGRSVLEPDPALGAPTSLADGLARTAAWFRERNG